MTDFALKECGKCGNEPRLLRIEKYAKFLKQPLTLGMFVPCDDDGNALKEQDVSEFHPSDWKEISRQNSEFEKAKEKVLFEGFKLVEWRDNTFEIISDTAPNFITVFKKLNNKDWEARFNKVEDLTKTIIDIELTESAIKSVGL